MSEVVDRFDARTGDRRAFTAWLDGWRERWWRGDPILVVVKLDRSEALVYRDPVRAQRPPKRRIADEVVPR